MNSLVYQLNTLSGVEFEDVVCLVFKRKGYTAQTTAVTGDEGRDIIATNGSEVIVIECKHQQQSVGRPVVQKLHSAALTHHASSALLVTSGRVSQQAQKYADESTEKFVRIWDHDALVSEARQVNVFLVGDKGNASTSSTVYFSLPWSGCAPEDITRSALSQGLHSRPLALEHAVEFLKHDLSLRPTVWVDVSVNKKFSTQVGVIYHARFSDTRYFADSKIFDHETFSAISKRELHLLDHTEVSRYYGALRALPETTAYEEKIKASVSNSLSRRIHYRGANNVSYSRMCVIKPTDVRTSSKYVLVHAGVVDFKTGPQKHKVALVNVEDCIQARAPEKWKLPAVLCNDCGNIERLWKNIARQSCSHCSRTLCKAHKWKSLLLIVWHGKAQSYCSTCFSIKVSKITNELRYGGWIVAVGSAMLTGTVFSVYTRPLYPDLPATLGFGGGGFLVGFVMADIFLRILLRRLWKLRDEAKQYKPEWNAVDAGE